MGEGLGKGLGLGTRERAMGTGLGKGQGKEPGKMHGGGASKFSDIHSGGHRSGKSKERHKKDKRKE